MVAARTPDGPWHAAQPPRDSRCRAIDEQKARIDGVQTFRGKVAMFWDRKILASPCFGRRVELSAHAAGRGQRRTVSESERPGVDTEQTRSSRGTLRCAIARCALVGARAPPTSPPYCAGSFRARGGGTNRAAARACCHARTCSAARRPQTTYSSGMREPSAVSIRLLLLCHPASPPTPPLRASDAEGHVIFKFTQQTKRRV
jgi:hypothetical protein